MDRRVAPGETTITILQAFTLGIALAVLMMLLTVVTVLLMRQVENRRLAKRWKAALKVGNGRVTVLPGGCTCCPVHAGMPPERLAQSPDLL